MTPSLRYLQVYPAYGPARATEEDAYAERMRARGAHTDTLGIPCDGGWWPFPVLDQRYRSSDRGLLAAYEELAQKLQSYDVLIAAGGSMLHPAFLDQLRVQKILICADDPENSDNLSRPIAAHFDHCFVVNAACVGDYAKWGAKSASWLPPVLREERIAAGVTERRILYGHRDLDVVLCCDRAFGIGNRAARADQLVAEFPQAWVRGRGWPEGPALAAEVADAYSRSKLGWNLHHSIGPVNTRLLELPANGVLQLCDNRQHLGAIFELDREVIGFDTIAECLDKTRYYLEHDDERRRIAAAGHARVLRDYTEDKQWLRIAEVAKRLCNASERRPESAARLTTAPPTVPHQKPKVWLLADRRGWAYDREAQAMAQWLAPEFECRVAYVQEQPDLGGWDFDLIWVFFWGETWHQHFTRDPRQVVKMIGSHRWQNEAAYGLLDPKTFAAEHLADAGAVAAISRRLQTILQPVRPVALVSQGIDPSVFKPAASAPRGELRVGWAGNRNDACKGLTDILEPACQGRFDLAIAGGEHGPDAMASFYQELDVLCVASTAEGGPLPLLEALACGVFVVTTDVGIAREVVDHGTNGLVVARNPAAFRAALHWCEANLPEVRSDRLVRSGNLHATRSWQAVMHQRASVLRDALGSSSPRTQSSAVVAPVPQSAVQQLQSNYRAHLQHVSGAAEETYRAASTYYRAELQAVLPVDRSARIAEVGCGFGHLLRFLLEQGYTELVGCDLDGELAAATTERLQGRAIVDHADARSFLASAPARFDLVLAYDILEHFDLDGALAFAAAARTSLRPGGTVVFRTPNMANLLGGYSRYMDLTHRIGFTEQSAGQLLRAAGFAAVTVIEAQHEPGPFRDELLASRRLHQQMFAQQDRSRPTCFDKNLVIAATVPAATGAQPILREPLRQGALR
jgi:2-polyprenyl-3-methyl-5-hydroxy-6-metoxy-1,4-benzoquinol methylase